MEYPRDFPTESRVKVEAARIRAGRRFDSDKAKAKWNSEIETLFKSYVLTTFLAFAEEAWRLQLWPADKMRENCQEFLRLLTIEAYFQKGKAAGLRDMISNWNGSILWEFQQEIEKTAQWRKFENILLKLARGSTGGEKHPEPFRTQGSTNVAQSVESSSTNAAANNTQEAFIDRAIASRKRRLKGFGMREESRNANLPPALDAQQGRALLGIELARLEHLRRGVWKKVFDEARIPDVVKTEWQSVLSLRRMPDSGVDLGLTFALTKEYEKAIERGSAQLADLLATAAGSRINQAQLREAIWRECLDFAYHLGQWDAFATWVSRTVHIGWQALDADGQPSMLLDRESENRLEERRKFFEERIGMYSQEWLSAIDEAIELRLTVSFHFRRSVNLGCWWFWVQFLTTPVATRRH